MTPQETIRNLAAHVKAAVFPNLGTWRARKVTGTASSGDATFDIDDIAEAAVEQFLQEHHVNVAYYSEDRGLVHPFPDQSPEGILIIDPIDGTRSAIAGLEACVVSIAWADYCTEPTLADVRYAAIAEIKGNYLFSAERGAGVCILDGAGNSLPPTLSPTTDIAHMAWTLEVVGAPLDLIFRAVGDMASQTTLKGGFFILNSSAYELTRLLTGQLAGVVDVRNRLLRDFPETREAFARYGGGRPISLYGYDLAAAALIAQEAGCVLSDAWGQSLDQWKLLDTTEANFGSLIAASNPTLHTQILDTIEEGFKRLHAKGINL